MRPEKPLANPGKAPATTFAKSATPAAPTTSPEAKTPRKRKISTSIIALETSLGPAEPALIAPLAVENQGEDTISASPDIIEATHIPEPALIEPPVHRDPPMIVSSEPPFKMVKFMAETMSSSPYKSYENIAAFNKANLEAVVLSNQILVKGLEELSKEVLSISQSSVENATSAAKAIWSARSVQDFLELNADYTKSMFDKFVSNSSKLTELGVKVATDALGPVTARVHTAVETAIKPASVL